MNQTCSSYQPQPNPILSSHKPHFEVLDGLRGIAAIVVLIYHILDTFSIGAEIYLPIVGHGYLAVDFFFVLSGFVIGYAYDMRWGQMRFTDFIKRRFIRLHPMVLLGTLLGVVLFYMGSSPVFPLIADTSVWKLGFFGLLGVLMIPVSPSQDIRGWQEMYTLDAPAWSLFYEYIANIIYGLAVYRFSKCWLAFFVCLFGGATLWLCWTEGTVSGGWEWSEQHILTGFIRVLYPFFAGLLLYRAGRIKAIKHAFLLCSLLLVAVLFVPQAGKMNGIYEAFLILLLFPSLVYLGACGKITGKRAAKGCKLLGDLSYPIYLLNYPIVYIFTGYVSHTGRGLEDCVWQAIAVFGLTIALAWIVMRYLDEPIRTYLRKVWEKDGNA